MRPRPFSAAGLAKEAAPSMGQAHEALPDRATARELVGGAEDGWEWAERAGTCDFEGSYDFEGLVLEPATCATSVAAVSPAAVAEASEDDDAVIFPACFYRSTAADHRGQLMSAVRRWLRAGAGSQGVELGRLTNSEHPAVAAAARCAGSRVGVAMVQLGLFAQRGIARCEVLCEYQGVRLTSPVGCTPWASPPAPGRASYCLALATAARGGSAREALRTLPEALAHPGALALWSDSWAYWRAWCADETEEIVDMDAKDTLGRRAAVEAARRRRRWMAQLLGFVAAPAPMREAVAALIPVLAPDPAEPEPSEEAADEGGASGPDAAIARCRNAITVERSSFAQCVKFDALTPAPPELKELELRTIEGVLWLFAEHGSARHAEGVGELLVLGPGLTGVRDSGDPNVALRALHQSAEATHTPQQLLELVATRDIAEGDVITCDHAGCARGPPAGSAFDSEAVLQRRAAAQRLMTLLTVAAEAPHSGDDGAWREAMRAGFEALAEGAGDVTHWSVLVGRQLMLRV